jgi:C1A family cysteine protease
MQTPVKNQLDTDWCAFYAVSAMFESVIKSHFNVEIDVSERWEWHRAKIIKNQRPEVQFGDTVQIAENLVSDLYVMTEDQRRIDFRHLKTELLNNYWSSKTWSERIIEQLKEKRSVVLTIQVAVPYVDEKSGYLSYNLEIDTECKLGKIACGGHAILITGYDTEKKLFFFKNSWGENWGERGYGSISFDHVNYYSGQPVVLYFMKYITPWANLN